MTKPLFFKVTSDQLLLCVFLSLLWGITDSNTTDKTTVTSSSTTPPPTTPSKTTTPKPPPENVQGVEVTGQSENSITLMWDKVSNIPTYLLQYKDNPEEERIDSPDSGASVTYNVSSLTAGTNYSFTLFTLFEEVKSSGYRFQAGTVPSQVASVSVTERSTTNITLEWDVDVDKNWSYYLQMNGESVLFSPDTTTGVVSYSFTSLQPGTEYPFSVITHFFGLNSSAYEDSTATIPSQVTSVSVTKRSTTSITLEWNVDVDKNWSYYLQMNRESVLLLPNTTTGVVSYSFTSLQPGTEYPFSVITHFFGLNSSAYENSTATIPSQVTSVSVTERSTTRITLGLNVHVDKNWNYFLQMNGESVLLSPDKSTGVVSYSFTSLQPGTEYPFSVITHFFGLNSSAYEDSAATIPSQVTSVSVTERSTTIITLEWDVDVDKNWSYYLQMNGESVLLSPDTTTGVVSYSFTSLQPGTEYPFSVITHFFGLNSSAYENSTATIPSQVTSVSVTERSTTSITLELDMDVDKNGSYYLQMNGESVLLSPDKSTGVVSYSFTSLQPGTEYPFSVITHFFGLNSSAYENSTATIPAQVTLVNVTERSTTSITLEWDVDVDKNWSYYLQMNGKSVLFSPDTTTGVVSYSFTSLQPGTEYPFSVITHFFGLNSSAYEDSTVTRIDCASVQWHVTTSSIQGMVEGLFTNATARNKSQEHVSPGGPNVSFTGLYPGATYELYLWYENSSKTLDQCEHNLTIIPPLLKARCEHWAGGYSVRIAWDEPQGVWTAVEVNVMGKSCRKDKDDEHYTILSGFLPAKRYEVSLTSLSGTGKDSEQRSEPYVFSCATDPRGVIAGSVFAVLLFVVLVCLVVFILLKRPDIIRRKKVRSKLPDKKTISVAKFPDHFYQLSGDDNRGFSQEYESLIPVGTEQTRKEAVLPENKARNRFNNVLPYDWCRVKLTTSDPNVTSDYINASYMPGYNNSREYIATQGPLPSTVNDFWRMIWEQNVKGIVMVTNCTEGGRTKCEQYWPAKSDPCPYGQLTVTMNSEQQEPNWTLREFRVKHSQTSEERTVRHFHFTAWPDHGVPQGTEVLIQFRGLVRQHIQREGAGAPTVVHCSAGVGRTGTIIALDVLLQQLEKERAAGINAFVHKMRLNRPHMVQTESQYIFLHQCIMDCLQPKEKMEENVYENAEMIYVNATALKEFHKNA